MDNYQYKFESVYDFVSSFPVSIVGSVVVLVILYLFFYVIKHFPKNNAFIYIISPFHITLFYLEGPIGVLLSVFILFLISQIPVVKKIRSTLRDRSFLKNSNSFLAREIQVDRFFGFISYLDAILLIISVLFFIFFAFSFFV